MSLNPCIQCKSPAVEQVRGKMGPGDYKEVQKINAKGHYVDDMDFYKSVYLDHTIDKDIRISCSKCDNATGWTQPDVPGMPGVGLDFSRKLWNERNPI
jgi:hypothetical protein